MLLLPLLYLIIVLNQKQLKQGLYFDSCICGDMYVQQNSAMLWEADLFFSTLL